MLEHAVDVVIGQRAAAVAQDADAGVAGALDHRVDRVAADGVARDDAVALGVEDAAQLALELGVEHRAGEVELDRLVAPGVLGVLDQPQAQVAGLEVAAGVERVHDPQLIARAAGGDVEHLAGLVALAHRQRQVGG